MTKSEKPRICVRQPSSMRYIHIYIHINIYIYIAPTARNEATFSQPTPSGQTCMPKTFICSHPDMYSYVHACIHTYTHTYQRTYMLTCTQTYTHTRKRTYACTIYATMHADAPTRLYAHVKRHAHTFVPSTCMHRYIHTFIHTYAHIYKHAYIHTYIHIIQP